MDLLKLKKIKLLLLDVDGVLTGGEIIYSDTAMETKVFNVKDGLGIRMLLNAGIDIGIVTGRRSDALNRRLADLGITMVYDGVKRKGALLNSIMQKTGYSNMEIAYVGDDLPDLPLLKTVGVSFAVANAHESVIEAVDITTKQNGGDGAVREISELILKTNGMWENILKSWE